ncbi:acyltransferase family protein [Lacisediminihabitans sp.]|uniref:acyltransferase family protein n=1 Tax=Lacisediminihabitans sp. TaxID=2787631 RepID=UPI00374D3B8F
MSTPSVAAAKSPAGHAYNPALDGLRAVAILAVVAQHAGIPGLDGYHGVTLFFVISGYLITGLLLKEHDRSGGIRLARFYGRRFARLVPALIVVIAATCLWLAIRREPIASYWGGIIGSLTFTTDLIQPFFGNGSVGHYFQWSWSLGVEELFYLVWPMSLILLARWHRFAAAVTVLVAGVVGCWALRAFLISDGMSHNRFYFAPDTNADALLLGALLALVLVRWPRSRALRMAGRIAGPLGLLALVALVWPYSGDALVHMDKGAFGQAALASAALVLWMATSPAGRVAAILSWPPVVLVGKLSYGIYLWNLLTIFVLASIVHLSPIHSWWGVAWFASLIGVAYLSWRFVETPLRARWAPG